LAAACSHNIPVITALLQYGKQLSIPVIVRQAYLLLFSRS